MSEALYNGDPDLASQINQPLTHMQVFRLVLVSILLFCVVLFCTKFYQRKHLQPIKARSALLSVVGTCSWMIIPVGMTWLDLFPGYELCLLPGWTIFLGFYTFASCLLVRMFKIYHTINFTAGAIKNVQKRVEKVQIMNLAKDLSPNQLDQAAQGLADSEKQLSLRPTWSASGQSETRSSGFSWEKWALENRKYLKSEYMLLYVLFYVVVQAIPSIVHWTSWASKGNNVFAVRGLDDACNDMWEKVIFISGMWLLTDIVFVVEFNRRLWRMKENFGIGKEFFLINVIMVYIFVAHEINEGLIPEGSGESINKNFSAISVQLIPAYLLLWVSIIRPYRESFSSKWSDVNSQITKSLSGGVNSGVASSAGDQKEDQPTRHRRRTSMPLEELEHSVVETLSSELGWIQYRDFLAREFCAESVLFWKEAVSFRKKFSSLSSESQIASKAQQMLAARDIYDFYIAENATMQINLSYQMVREMKAILDNDKEFPVDGTCFNACLTEMERLLAMNSWHRFQNYLDTLSTENQTASKVTTTKVEVAAVQTGVEM